MEMEQTAAHYRVEIIERLNGLSGEDLARVLHHIRVLESDKWFPADYAQHMQRLEAQRVAEPPVEYEAAAPKDDFPIPTDFLEEIDPAERPGFMQGLRESYQGKGTPHHEVMAEMWKLVRK